MKEIDVSEEHLLKKWNDETKRTRGTMNEVTLGKEIWPDVDGTAEVNNFLGRIGVKVDFLLTDGIKLTYPENLELYQVSTNSCYLRDVKTKSPVLHYYEDFGELVFIVGEEEYTIPILEEGLELYETK